MQSYKRERKMTEESRKILVDIIIQHFISQGLKMSVAGADKLSDEIVTAFPEESKVNNLK